MTSNTISTSGRSVGLVDAAAMLLGVGVFGYGLLLVSTSALGGAWIAAIGLSLALSGLFATEWVGGRLDLATGTRRRLSLASAVLAAFLLVAFVVVNV